MKFDLNTYFPFSAVMYSSQETVFGEGGIKDCLLTGWRTQKNSLNKQVKFGSQAKLLHILKNDHKSR